MEIFTTLIAATGAWIFWITISIWSLVLLVCLFDLDDREHARRSGAPTVFTLAFGGYIVWSLYKTGQSIAWASMVQPAIVYIAIGFAWMFLKWAIFCRKDAKYWKEYIYHERDKVNKYTLPDYRQHLGRLYNWCIFWPFSLFISIIGDGLRKIWELVARMFASVFKMIAKSVTSDIV